MSSRWHDSLHLGSCLEVLPQIETGMVDLIYLDPPFFTQRSHKLRSRKGDEYSFDDRWDSRESYLSVMRHTLEECRRILAPHGSIFLHCDRSASHHLRLLLDEIFGEANFQSEIIWSYRRWSNLRRGLMNAHQNIYFYSRTNEFKFNTIYTAYSPSTNVDQILQERQRAQDGKSTYRRDEQGNIILGKEKKGVPLSDVWDIPYLNPKAKERVGYPTQKPLALLKRIISLCTDEGDLVLDPFMGSGTTCVASKLLGRSYIGIDISEDALRIAQDRLNTPIESESIVLKNGLASFEAKSSRELTILDEIGAIPVQRNAGIDGYLRQHIGGKPVPIRIQREGELLEDTIAQLERAANRLGLPTRIVIQTSLLRSILPTDSDTIVIPSLSTAISLEVARS